MYLRGQCCKMCKAFTGGCSNLGNSMAGDKRPQILHHLLSKIPAAVKQLNFCIFSIRKA